MNVSFFSSACDVFLEVEIRKNGANHFETKYQKLTGVLPCLGCGYQHQKNKWGGEYRVYFNADASIISELSRNGIHVESGSRPYYSSRKYRVNNKDFFWALVSSGYILGEN